LKSNIPGCDPTGRKWNGNLAELWMWEEIRKCNNVFMNELDVSAFRALYKQAYEKCFGHPIAMPLSETESKAFANKIFDQTGLVIGPKSIKNYSFFILGHPEAKEENPSIATLDTMARYATDAPYTDETQRKLKENHYPYWFQYKDAFLRRQKPPVKRKGKKLVPSLIVIAIVVVVSVVVFRSGGTKTESFADDFTSVEKDTLIQHGWFVKSTDEGYWKKRNEHPGQLTLYTLRGDNWPDPSNKPDIKNLLVRSISSECFTAEVHLSEFIPSENWQQAGLLLLEDTGFLGKSIRVSILYNDFYGGFPRSKDIVVQAITAGGKGLDKPEEITHQLVFKLDPANEILVKQNLRHSALRIEKRGKKFRILYANGSMANSAFKEIIDREIDISPRYIALFAIKGFVDSAGIIPARFDLFNYRAVPCER